MRVTDILLGLLNHPREYELPTNKILVSNVYNF